MTNDILTGMFDIKDIANEVSPEVLKNINLNITNKELNDILVFITEFYDVKIEKENVYIDRNKWAEMVMKIAKLIDCYKNIEAQYIRLKYDLPKTKDLIYYDIDKIKHKVVRVIVHEKHKSYDTLEITLDNGENHLIYDDYFKQMQKPNFIETIKEQRHEKN